MNNFSFAHSNFLFKQQNQLHCVWFVTNDRVIRSDDHHCCPELHWRGQRLFPFPVNFYITLLFLAARQVSLRHIGVSGELLVQSPQAVRHMRPLVMLSCWIFEAGTLTDYLPNSTICRLNLNHFSPSTRARICCPVMSVKIYRNPLLEPGLQGSTTSKSNKRYMTAWAPW